MHPFWQLFQHHHHVLHQHQDQECQSIHHHRRRRHRHHLLVQILLRHPLHAQYLTHFRNNYPYRLTLHPIVLFHMRFTVVRIVAFRLLII